MTEISEITFDQATHVTSLIVRTCLFMEGVLDIEDTVVSELQSISLESMLASNRIVSNANKQLNATTRQVVTTDAAIANLYLRLNDPNYKTINDVEEVAKAACDVFDPKQFYGVLIDDQGNSTILQLDRTGIGGRDVMSDSSFSRLYRRVVDINP